MNPTCSTSRDHAWSKVDHERNRYVCGKCGKKAWRFGQVYKVLK